MPSAPAPARLLALDFETSGLDARRDALVAVGTVPVVERTIRWGEAFRALVDDPRHARPRDLEALAAHQVLPSEKGGGIGLVELVDRLAAATAAGWVLLVHGAVIERAFLGAAARAVGRSAPRVAIVDTLEYLRAIGRVREHLVDRLPSEARRHSELPTALAVARALFGLPPYVEHDPLLDALGAAELYLLLSCRFPELHPNVRN
jgi:DNA polymerase-3 subunit epsilon